MPHRSHVFLSYNRKDRVVAEALEAALQERRVRVWRDVRSILAGEDWALALENGIRDSRGVIVIISAASADSEWVPYEYAFAAGAHVPVVAVRIGRATIPAPLRRLQFVQYLKPGRTAKAVDKGLRAQSRTAGRERATEPVLVAKFQESNGRLVLASKGKLPSIEMDLWMEQVPKQTRRVAFEILDLGFDEPEWTVKRRKRDATTQRKFLTEMNSWGDVEIWAGGGGGNVTWAGTSRLYEALMRYYRGKTLSPVIRKALKQIRDN